MPALSPNLNAFAERFVRSIKDECLTKMIFVGQGILRRAIREYVTAALARMSPVLLGELSPCELHDL